MCTFCMHTEAFLLPEERKETNVQDYSINELIEKISADTIIIPRSVAFRKDVYEESKTLFGVVFTECVNDLSSYGSFIDGKSHHNKRSLRKRRFYVV